MPRLDPQPRLVGIELARRRAEELDPVVAPGVVRGRDDRRQVEPVAGARGSRRPASAAPRRAARRRRPPRDARGQRRLEHRAGLARVADDQHLRALRRRTAAPRRRPSAQRQLGGQHLARDAADAVGAEQLLRRLSHRDRGQPPPGRGASLVGGWWTRPRGGRGGVGLGRGGWRGASVAGRALVVVAGFGRLRLPKCAIDGRAGSGRLATGPEATAKRAWVGRRVIGEACVRVGYVSEPITRGHPQAKLCGRLSAWRTAAACGLSSAPPSGAPSCARPASAGRGA